MPAARRSALLTAFWKFHRWIYEWSGGRIGSRLMGIQIIRLTTIGRKSAKPRSVLLNAFPVGENFAIVGSNAGGDSHPLWYLNLRANPAATVDIAGSQFGAVARFTQGEERDRLWAEVISANPSYAEYSERTDRLIPVVVLERQTGDLEPTA
ncbi:MAG: nitroreductase family deazaflavin-dependent oxidoreductase [Anaerolineales bacterium]